MQCHENTIGVFGVVTKRSAVCEAKALVEPLGGLKCIYGASFKAQALVASRSGNFDRTRKDGSSRAFTAQRLGRTHGLDLAMLTVEFFEGATAKQLRTFPSSPKRDLGLAEFLKVQCVDTFRRRKLVHALQVFVEQCMCKQRRKMRMKPDLLPLNANPPKSFSCGSWTTEPGRWTPTRWRTRSDPSSSEEGRGCSPTPWAMPTQAPICTRGSRRPRPTTSSPTATRGAVQEAASGTDHR
jgi:hypothetical protein